MFSNQLSNQAIKTEQEQMHYIKIQPCLFFLPVFFFFDQAVNMTHFFSQLEAVGRTAVVPAGLFMGFFLIPEGVWWGLTEYDVVISTAALPQKSSGAFLYTGSVYWNSIIGYVLTLIWWCVVCFQVCMNTQTLPFLNNGCIKVVFLVLAAQAVGPVSCFVAWCLTLTCLQQGQDSQGFPASAPQEDYQEPVYSSWQLQTQQQTQH